MLRVVGTSNTKNGRHSRTVFTGTHRSATPQVVLTTSEIVEGFIAHHVGELASSPQTVSGYRHYGKTLVDAFPGDFDQITTGELQAWCSGTTEQAWSGGYITQRASFCRCLWKWALSEQLATSDPTGRLKTPKIYRRHHRPLTDIQVGHLLDACRDLRTRLLVLFMAQEGLRCIEVSRLTWADISNGQVQVRGKAGRGAVTRLVQLSDQTAESLAVWRRMTNPNRETELPVFQNQLRPGRPLHSKTIQHYVTEAFWSSGVKESKHDGFSPHSLRATAATHLHEDTKGNTRAVQRFLGHSDVGVTERYLVGSQAGLEAMPRRHYG